MVFVWTAIIEFEISYLRMNEEDGMKRIFLIGIICVIVVLLSGCQADEITSTSLQTTFDDMHTAPPIEYTIESKEEYELLLQAANQTSEKEFQAFRAQGKRCLQSFKSRDDLTVYLDRLHKSSSSFLCLNTSYEKVVLSYCEETKFQLRWRLRYAITPLSGQEDVPDYLKKYQIIDVRYYEYDEEEFQNMEIPYPIVKTTTIDGMSVPIRETQEGEFVAHFYKNGYLVAVWGFQMSSEDLDTFASALASATFFDAASKQ